MFKMRAVISLAACCVLLCSIPAAAATNSNKMAARPAQYTSAGPDSPLSTVIYRENFEGVSDAESAGYYPSYVEEIYGEWEDNDYYCIPACDVTVSSKYVHSGRQSLLVSNRQKVYGRYSNSGNIQQLDHTGGEFSFVLTDKYYYAGERSAEPLRYCDIDGNRLYGYEWAGDKDGAVDLGRLIANSCGDVTKKENVSYFFQMWVYTETAQSFLPKLQYMGSNELWIPADDYWEVPANTWTLVGGYVEDGVGYYASLVGEGGSELYGVYGPTYNTTETKLLVATKSRDSFGNVVFTNGDFWVDDIAIWKVSDKAAMFDMEYTLSNGQTYTGLDGLIKIENARDVKSTRLVNAFGIPMTTTAPTTTATTRPPAQIGDANADGDINMKDVLCIRKYVAGYDVFIDRYHADITRDDVVNMKDVLSLRLKIASL